MQGVISLPDVTSCDKSFYSNFDPQSFKTQNEQFDTYCINMFGKIHQNEKD